MNGKGDVNANLLSSVATASGRVYVTARCPSDSPAAAACGGFAAVGPAMAANRRYRSIAARCVCCRRGRLSIHIHSSTAVSSKCGQCHVCRDVGS